MKRSLVSGQNEEQSIRIQALDNSPLIVSPNQNMLSPNQQMVSPNPNMMSPNQ
jgi:hypothetical protein